MVDNNGSSPTSRRRHILRLGVFAGLLLGLFYVKRGGRGVVLLRAVEHAAVRHLQLGGSAQLTEAAGSAGRKVQALDLQLCHQLVKLVRALVATGT
jgi:hypothetical protein